MICLNTSSYFTQSCANVNLSSGKYNLWRVWEPCQLSWLAFFAGLLTGCYISSDVDICHTRNVAKTHTAIVSLITSRVKVLQLEAIRHGAWTLWTFPSSEKVNQIPPVPRETAEFTLHGHRLQSCITDWYGSATQDVSLVQGSVFWGLYMYISWILAI